MIASGVMASLSVRCGASLTMHATPPSTGEDRPLTRPLASIGAEGAALAALTAAALSLLQPPSASRPQKRAPAETTNATRRCNDIFIKVFFDPQRPGF